MKSIIKTVFLAAILLILFFYFFQNTPVIKKDTNTISNQAISANLIKEETTKKIKIKKQTNDILTSDEGEPEKNEGEIKETQIDYITAFRDWQYFENCYTDIEDFGNNKDPLDTLAERFENNPRESQQQPSAQQNYYYQHHVDICKTLINEVGDENDNYSQIRSKLNQRFTSIKPKTNEEKQLERALQMIKQLESYKLEYNKAHTPESNLSPLESNDIHNQIEDFTIEMMSVYNGNSPLTQDQVQLIEQYSEKIESLQNIVRQSKQINAEKIEKIESVIDGYLNSMDDYLHRVQSADAFILIATELYKFEYMQNKSTVIKTMQAQTSIQDLYYLSLLNNITIPLVACSMNYPCDAESDLILSYCLGLKDSMFNQACGTSLEEFYFNFYIGANQLGDVNNYFTYLVNRYAN
jgi:hypothetical protein